MRIKILASTRPTFPDRGPYKTLDIVETHAPYSVGEITQYGEVITIPPPIHPDVDQSVIVKLNPASLSTGPDESVFEKPPSSLPTRECVEPSNTECHRSPVWKCRRCRHGENLRSVRKEESSRWIPLFNLRKRRCRILLHCIALQQSHTRRDVASDLRSPQLIRAWAKSS
jgi:hypothetical protein